MRYCDQPPALTIDGSVSPSVNLTPERAKALDAVWAAIGGCLATRILSFAAMLQARGDRTAYARPAYYRADNSGSATAGLYGFTLSRSEGPLVVCSIEHPQEGGANVLASALRVGGRNRIDSDALCDAWCDPEGTTEDPRNLPHPIVIGTGDTFALDVTGPALITTGLQVRGFHVDEVTAEIIARGGELYVEGFNRTHAAAAVMAATDDRVVREHKQLTHLVAKETLAGDTVRAAVSVTVRGQKWAPKDAAIIPPRGIAKALSRVDVALAPNDSIQIAQRYTSAGGAGTAVLQMTALGRKRFR
ncbi:MAG: hypothetical protein IT382_01890 [Deltaproteobacteria bacterium]|nr:hypothetical protein [Deltaproteobacteria bacterium]